MCHMQIRKHLVGSYEVCSACVVMEEGGCGARPEDSQLFSTLKNLHSTRWGCILIGSQKASD